MTGRDRRRIKQLVAEAVRARLEDEARTKRAAEDDLVTCSRCALELRRRDLAKKASARRRSWCKRCDSVRRSSYPRSIAA